MTLRFASVVAIALLLGCETKPPAGPSDTSTRSDLPAPTPPAPIAQNHLDVCAALSRVGCPEAHPKTGTCEGDLAQATGNRESIAFTCLSAAKTREEVWRCNGPGYLPIRCKP